MQAIPSLSCPQQVPCILCSDNRLMSDTNLTREMELAVQYYNLNIRDLEKITINAMKSAFIHHDQKLSIIYDVIKKDIWPSGSSTVSPIIKGFA
jgi:adenosine deaminase